MIEINTKAIASLRDRLLETGSAPSVLVVAPQAMKRASEPLGGDREAIALFEAIVEAMFLMLSADGSIQQSEKDLLRGAIRELTTGTVTSEEVDEMFESCANKLASEGSSRRMVAAASTLRADPVAAEAGFILAAAMAFADDEIADEENDTLNTLAELLGINSDRANELLDQLEQD